MSGYAAFRKCDFQVHSCRDPNWRGVRPPGVGDALAGGSVASVEDVEAARNDWARRFVDACMTRGLEAVAITDHHEMVMVKYVQDEIARRVAAGSDPNLWLFPGMELTFQEGAQAIILFDADLDRQWWTNVQGALGIAHAAIDETKAAGNAVTQLGFAYDHVPDRLKGIVDVKGRYIVLPNVTQGGANTVVKHGWHQRFKAMSYVGGYLDTNQTIDTCSSAHQQKLSGTDEAWGNRRIYPLPTSDARDEGFPSLGGNNAWIKLSVPTAESIRQAFLAWPSRIRLAEPSFPDITVKSLAIQGASPMADMEVTFSPELNCIIGGRGSGKSTVLEYLAFGLGRSCYDLPTKEYSGKERLVSLIKDTIIASNAQVAVELTQDGAPFRIVRNATSGYQPVLTYPNGRTETVPDRELRSLFPAVAYSQGELSELGSANAGTKITDLLAFVEPTFKYEADQLETRIAAGKTQLDGAYRTLVELWTAEAEKAKIENRINALKARVTGLQGTLPKLEEADQATLDKHEKLAALSQEKEKFEADMGAFANSLDALRSEADHLEALKASADSPTFAAYAQTANAAVSKVREALAGVRTQLSQDQTDLEARTKPWIEEFTEHTKVRDAVLGRVGVHSAVQKQISELQANIIAETRRLQDLERRIAAIPDPVADIRTKRASLKALIQEQVDKLKLWTSQIEEHSDYTVIVKMDEDGDLSEAFSALEMLAAKTRSVGTVRERNFTGLVDDSNAWQALDTIIAETAAALRWRIFGADPKATPRIDNVAGVLGEGDTVGRAFLEQVEMDRMAALVKAVPKAKISFMYKADGGEVTFDKASEGQRAAALLMMLIKQGGGPLLVDQPEGDLDNSVVTRVVELMHQMKHRRQIFFATHNANLVVNGASELVAVMANTESGARVVKSRGAIDITAISNSITKTMEGGEQAFRDRQRKYGF